MSAVLRDPGLRRCMVEPGTATGERRGEGWSDPENPGSIQLFPVYERFPSLVVAPHW